MGVISVFSLDGVDKGMFVESTKSILSTLIAPENRPLDGPDGHSVPDRGPGWLEFFRAVRGNHDREIPVMSAARIRP